MSEKLIDFMLDIPYVIGKLGEWLLQPIYPPYISLSPLALFGIGGVATIILIIGVHVVRLFVG